VDDTKASFLDAAREVRPLLGESGMLHASRLRLPFFLSLLSLAPLGGGCLPTRGTMPTHTFRVEDEEGACAPEWSAADRATLSSKRERDEPVVASILGCHAEVLRDCTVPGRASAPRVVLATELEGPCVGATHVVRETASEHVEVRPLSLGDYRLTGTFRGLLLQPHGGPYETYDATMYLAQDGEHVTGVTRLSTVDEEYWGDLQFEGRLEGNVLFFADVNVLDEHVPMLAAWCAKGGYMVVDPRDGHLTGPWRAPLCAPGTLDLHRVPDRPRVLIPAQAVLDR
jgi:hypothetical protein